MVELLKPKEVAKQLRIDYQSVLKYAKSGELKSVKIGGRNYMFTQSQVDEFIQKATK